MNPDSSAMLQLIIQLKLVEAELEVALFELKKVIAELEKPYLLEYGKEEEYEN